MNTTCEKKDENLVVFSFEVEQDEFEKYKNQAFLKDGRKYKIHGFRPGKAPRKMIEARYGKDTFVQEGLNLLMIEAYDKVLLESGYIPVDRPNIEIKQLNEQDKPLQFSISVIVEPEVELGEYKGIEVHKKGVEVSEEEIETKLQDIAFQNSRLVEVNDRDAVVNDDVVYISYKCLVDDEIIDQQENYATGIEIKEDTRDVEPNEKTFAHSLIGAKLGEQCEFSKKPSQEDEANSDLKGKMLHFIVTINAIKQRELPIIDDEFVKDISSFDNLEDFKKQIATDLKSEKEKEEKEDIRTQIIDTLIKTSIIDIPPIMIKNKALDLIESSLGSLYRDRNLEFDIDKVDSSILDSASKLAERIISMHLITKAIYTKEKDFFESQLKEDHTENLDYMSEDGYFGKVINMLIENAKFI